MSNVLTDEEIGMQEFEKHEKLKSHILRMASTGSVGSPSFWNDFISDLNDALSVQTERSVLAKAGEQEPVAYCRHGDLEKEDFVAITEPNFMHEAALYAHPAPQQAMPEIDAAIAKLRSAQICHERAVQVLIEEAIDILSASPKV